MQSSFGTEIESVAEGDVGEEEDACLPKEDALDLRTQLFPQRRMEDLERIRMPDASELQQVLDDQETGTPAHIDKEKQNLLFVEVKDPQSGENFDVFSRTEKNRSSEPSEFSSTKSTTSIQEQAPSIETVIF